MTRLEQLGVTEKMYHLFFSESFTLTPEEVEDAGIPFDKRCDHHFHPYTNIVWRSLLNTGAFVNGFIPNQQTVLLLHAWWRGYYEAHIVSRPHPYTIVKAADTRIKVAAIKTEISPIFLTDLYDTIRAAWRSNPHRSTKKWVDFTVETTWIDLYCNAKDFPNLSIICVKGIGLAPITHTHWNVNAKSAHKNKQPKDFSLQGQLQKIASQEVCVVPPKKYGLSLNQHHKTIPSEEDVGLLNQSVTKENFLQRGLRLFLGGK
ncbi:hypothetical protein IT409_00720 [Candidatus Falkowbacteria bacterium]|nr:hypothetical protein [Candidatus Falkowbacteria bacterium]